MRKAIIILKLFKYFTIETLTTQQSLENIKTLFVFLFIVQFSMF